MVSFVKGVILNTAPTYFPLSADSECVPKDDKQWSVYVFINTGMQTHVKKWYQLEDTLCV